MNTTSTSTVSTYQFYDQKDCPAVFRRSRDQWGELSNMTGGFPIRVNGVRFQSSEGLYQAMKFPHSPARQRKIADARNGYAAKLIAYQQGDQPNEQWDEQRIDAMRVALAFKLTQNPGFGNVLLKTEDYDIIEHSSKDAFWGAKPVQHGFEGANVLGKLLMELRNCLTKAGAASPTSAAHMFAATAFQRQFLVDGHPIALESTDQTQPTPDPADQPF